MGIIILYRSNRIFDSSRTIPLLRDFTETLILSKHIYKLITIGNHYLSLVLVYIQ
jgi:hypothetical protein